MASNLTDLSQSVLSSCHIIALFGFFTRHNYPNYELPVFDVFTVPRVYMTMNHRCTYCGCSSRRRLFSLTLPRMPTYENIYINRILHIFLKEEQTSALGKWAHNARKSVFTLLLPSSISILNHLHVVNLWKFILILCPVLIEWKFLFTIHREAL